VTVARLEVGVQIDGRTVVAGTAHFVRRGRSMSTTFTYRPDYLTLLPALLRASDRLSDDPDDLEAIKVLLGAGTGTLGGARPKASVRDGERLLVAKFPKPTDEWDVIAWEATALDIAERAGVTVPGRRLTHADGRAVLLLDRFDRIAADTRIGYWSAMTLLGAADGQSGDYVDFAEALA